MIFIFQEITPETALIYLIAYSSILVYMCYLFVIVPIVEDIRYKLKVNKEAKIRALKQKEFMDNINKLIKENESY